MNQTDKLKYAVSLALQELSIKETAGKVKLVLIQKEKAIKKSIIPHKKNEE